MGSDHLQQLWAGLEERICTCGAGHGSNEAHHIGCEWLEYHSTVELLMAMRDAGYRILAPGEVDAETVERCVKELNKLPWFEDVVSLVDVEATLRALEAQESGR